MQQFLPASDLKSRAGEIRLGVAALASAAGINPATLHRAMQGGGMHTSNAVALTQALIREERRLFEHLAALHPQWLGRDPGVPGSRKEASAPAGLSHANLEAAE